MQAKCYDVNSMVVEDTKQDHEPKRAWGTSNKLVILQGPKGYVVTDSEGVHFRLNGASDKVDVYCEPVPVEEENERCFRLAPTGYFEIPVQEIIEKAPSSEVELGTFVRTFGHRLEDNYRMLLQSIEEVGLDPKDYPRKVA